MAALCAGTAPTGLPLTIWLPTQVFFHLTMTKSAALSWCVTWVYRTVWRLKYKLMPTVRSHEAIRHPVAQAIACSEWRHPLGWRTYPGHARGRFGKQARIERDILDATSPPGSWRSPAPDHRELLSGFTGKAANDRMPP